MTIKYFDCETIKIQYDNDDFDKWNKVVEEVNSQVDLLGTKFEQGDVLFERDAEQP